VPDAELPALSVTRQVTVVVPSGKVEPARGLHTGAIEPSTSSSAPTEKLTVAPALLVASIVRSLGSANTGGVVSPTTTLKLPVAVLPELSVARQVTVVEPRPNNAPERGVQTVVTLVSTASEAVAV
jgi:hypothetical protein